MKNLMIATGLVMMFTLFSVVSANADDWRGRYHEQRIERRECRERERIREREWREHERWVREHRYERCRPRVFLY